PELLRRHQEAAAPGAEAVLASGASIAEVVDALRRASEERVPALPTSIASLWRLPELLIPAGAERMDRLVRARNLGRRVARISRNPVASYRRWSLRRRSRENPPSS